MAPDMVVSAWCPPDDSMLPGRVVQRDCPCRRHNDCGYWLVELHRPAGPWLATYHQHDLRLAANDPA